MIQRVSSLLASTARSRGARCWTLVGRAGPVDVEVLASDDDPLHAVLHEVGNAVGTPATSLFSGTTRLPGDLPLGDVRLRHGAVLGIDHPLTGGTDPTAAVGAVQLRVVGGVDAGRSVPLGAGTHQLGRGPESVVRLHDPDVSRRHVEIHVGSGILRVTDLGSSNGSRFGDEELAPQVPRAWPPGMRLRLGATELEVAGPDHPPAATGPGAAGRTVLGPPVRIEEVATPVEVAFPAPPSPPPARRLAWVAVALPAVGGVALAVALRAPYFLFFALLSPLVAVASWWSDRRTGRRAHRRETADHRLRTAAAEARLTEAVGAAVRGAHHRLPDLATLTAAARRRTAPVWGRGSDDADLLVVRVGTGPGATPVVRRDADGSRAAATADDLPVPVDLRSGGLAVVGPRARSLGVLRSVVGQLAALHPPDAVELLLVTSAGRLPDWRWARWLPHLRQTLPLLDDGPPGPSERDATMATFLVSMVERRRSAARAAPGRPWPGPWTAVVVDGSLPAAAATLLSRATDVGLTVLTHGEALGRVPVPVRTAQRVAGETGTTATLHADGAPARDPFALDELPPDLAAALARDLAGLTPPAGRSALPTDVRFLDLDERHSADGGELRPGWSRARGVLSAVLGVGPDGVERLDLCRHGPHALVAGTTGSGKSELLQTLVAGLASSHPPDRCSFLLVDYKGGAAFAEAAALPHTVGLLTDLDEATTARALRSLAAELARREAVLAAHAVADVTDLPEHVPLARLVIVVDEFATLAEELPGFVPGLVGIAQRGRSLGIHLVLATQRPAGVVSADIRANCTLRICLRTTDEADSRDVLGTPEAAHLPLEVPGRAYVRTGSGAARLVQAARVSQPAPSGDDGPVVVPWGWPGPSLRPECSPVGDSDLARIVRELGDSARACSLPPPHRPWRPPLPSVLTLTDAEAALSGATSRSPTQLLLGLVDRPDRQDQGPLWLDLSEGGGWLAVGGPRSGRTTVLRSVLRQATAGLAVDRLHVHVVDLGGGELATEARLLPQIGTVIDGEDPLRTVRLVHRLSEEVAGRRAVRAPDDPRLLLLLDGVEALCTLLDDVDPARGSAELLRLVRNGGAAGLTCVLTTDRAIPGGRLAAVARQRLVLPLSDRADYAVAGVPPAAVPSERPPGRAVVGEEAVECQLVLPPALAAARPAAGGGSVPLRIAELEPDPVVDGVLDDAARAALTVTVGPGGDEGELLSIGLLRTGGLLVVGPPGSGRSSTLEAVAGDLAAAGLPVLEMRTGPTSGGGTGYGAGTADGSDAAAVTDWLAGRRGRPAVVCVDDVGVAGGVPALGALPPLGPGSGVVLLAAVSAPDLATWFQGPVAALRRSRTGLLLRPGLGDADVLGTRLPRTPVVGRPGSGWLVLAGAPERVQVARHRVRPGGGQSSSSADPISCVAYQASS